MFTLGINYPWLTCGHDFGPRPPAWSGAPPHDWSKLKAEFSQLKALGLDVLRWWVLAGGVNYPVGERAPGFRLPLLDPRRRAYAWAHTLVAHPGMRPEQLLGLGPAPTWPRGSLDAFAAWLEAAQKAGVQLIPSLLSFEFFLPLVPHGRGVIGRGRGSYALGSPRRIDLFLDAALEPLLEVSASFPDSVFAWEVINEPDLAARPPGAVGRWWSPPPWAHPAQMSMLIERACRRIARRGLRSTVGFLHPRPSWLDAGALHTLRRLAADGGYIHQLHHYPRDCGRPHLPPASAAAVEPCLLGELATSATDPWRDPEVRTSEKDPERYLEARLRLAHERGYAGALLWSVTAQDHHSDFGPGQRAQVRRFAAGLPAIELRERRKSRTTGE